MLLQGSVAATPIEVEVSLLAASLDEDLCHELSKPVEESHSRKLSDSRTEANTIMTHILSKRDIARP